MFDWNDLKFFLAVAETGSLSAAARKLDSRQPTVGRRIQTLEENLKVSLFERHPRGYVLTDAGQDIMEAARDMEAAALELMRQVKGQDRALEGEVRLSTTEGLGI